MSLIQSNDPELYEAMRLETERQPDNLELIASENYCSRAVMEAAGSGISPNNYAEGYPGRRYYGGCQFVDMAENLARDRAKALFGSDHANVQPHSGSQANMGVYFSVIKPGDTILGMNLCTAATSPTALPCPFPGGSTTSSATAWTRKARPSTTTSWPGWRRTTKPKVIVAGASAYSRVIDFKRFREVADEVGALLMVDMAHIAGLVATGFHPSPIKYAHFTTTTTHKTLRGPRGGMVFVGVRRREHDRGHDAQGRPAETLVRAARQLDHAGHPGRPFDAHYRRQGGGPQGGAVSRLQDLYRKRGQERQGLVGGAVGGRSAHRVRRHRQPPHARGPHASGDHGKGSGVLAG